MPCGLFFQRLRRMKMRIEGEQDVEERRWRVELMTQARAHYYGLQANQDVPPTRAQANRKKPNWTEIEQNRKERLKQIEAYQKALSHPYHFEEHFGLGHKWEPPEGDAYGPRLTKREEIQEMKESLVAKLERMRDAHGDVDLRGQE